MFNVPCIIRIIKMKVRNEVDSPERQISVSIGLLQFVRTNISQLIKNHGFSDENTFLVPLGVS